MSRYETQWTGEGPTLCSGQWFLFRDGELLDIDIPFNDPRTGRGSDAGTWDYYPSWHFGDGWDVVWEEYESGLHEEEWCEKHRDWLSSFADPSEWGDIYNAFNVNDWRHNSCGGCI